MDGSGGSLSEQLHLLSGMFRSFLHRRLLAVTSFFSQMIPIVDNCLLSWRYVVESNLQKIGISERIRVKAITNDRFFISPKSV